MIDLPDSGTFAATLADKRFALAAIISALAGAARGFSGFGSALIYIPLISAIYDPKIAAATLLLIDTASGVPFGIHAFPRCDWRDVFPLTLASIIMVPLGTLLLLAVDPVALRWFIGVFVLSIVPVLASGWRYHGKPKLPIGLGVGALAGITNGAVQIAGPPVILYWLGGAIKAKTARANMIVFFAVLGSAACVSYFFEGLFTREPLALALLLGIPYTILFMMGAFSFHRASETFYRSIAYAIILISAFVSLPVFDRFFH
jgi:uncharacterized protein